MSIVTLFVRNSYLQEIVASGWPATKIGKQDGIKDFVLKATFYSPLGRDRNSFRSTESLCDRGYINLLQIFPNSIDISFQ